GAVFFQDSRLWRGPVQTGPARAGAGMRPAAAWPRVLEDAGSDGVRLHLLGDVVGLPDRQRDDRQRRVFGGAGGELAAVRHEQVPDVVRLAVAVDHTVLGLLAHAVGAEVVRGRVGRRREDARRADRVVEGRTLLVGMVA